jgi:hypothetical protein
MVRVVAKQVPFALWLLLGVLLPFSVQGDDVADKEIATLQTQIEARFDLKIGRRFIERYKIDDSLYLSFLRDFQLAAENKGLARRFFPVHFSVTVQNTKPERDFTHALGNEIEVAPEQKFDLVNFLCEQFPIKETDEAKQLARRYEAFLAALTYYNDAIQKKGFLVRLDLPFDLLGDQSLRSPRTISYFYLEKVLKGLMNIDRDIADGKISKLQVRLVDEDSFAGVLAVLEGTTKAAEPFYFYNQGPVTDEEVNKAILAHLK